MADKNHNGWTLVDGAWVKTGPGRGNADYFGKEYPPVRDGYGRPLVRGGNGQVDWNKWADEVTKKKGGPNE